MRATAYGAGVAGVIFGLWVWQRASDPPRGAVAYALVGFRLEALAAIEGGHGGDRATRLGSRSWAAASARCSSARQRGSSPTCLTAVAACGCVELHEVDAVTDADFPTLTSMTETYAAGPVRDDFKRAQRAMWAAGDYGALSEYISQVGELVVDRVGVQSGMRVLDVACGTGNAAIPAARAGARVTGLDLVPELLDGGRRKAAAAAVDVEWVEGDAEALPFEDGAFDRVLSTFGHMFAPRHRRVADEMARVCRTGGAIATCTWTPEGTVGEVFRASGSYMPPPPGFASPPILWGTQDHVREMFGAVAARFEFARHSATIEWESLDGFAEFFMQRFGPLVTAREQLGERFADLRAEIVGIWRAANQGGDGRLVVPQEYLLSVIHL